jgi:hypothetical protein
MLFLIPHSRSLHQFLLQRAYLVVKHLSQTCAFFQNGVDLLRLTEFNPSGKDQVGFVFLQTALSDLQKANVILVLSLPYPSATFAGTEALALRICKVIPNNSSFGKFRVTR